MTNNSMRGDSVSRAVVVPVMSLFLAITLVAGTISAQSTDPYRRILAVSASEPVTLDVDVPKGELQILYGREGQVSIFASPQSSGKEAVHTGFDGGITLLQNGNSIKLSYVAPPMVKADRILYRIDVPYRTVITSAIRDGKLIISGVMGPVRAETDRGDIKVSYVSKELIARAGTGDLDLQVIGAKVDARTSSGSIYCVRAARGVDAETQEGDITLMEVGSSNAMIKQGSGKINVAGIRGTLKGTTDTGAMHVKAVPYDNWQLSSQSGNVKIELPPDAKFEVDASSIAGEISVERDDTERSEDAHHLLQVVNGGGAHIGVRTETGRIMIQ